MRRDEAIDLLQVMLLDERQPPALTPKGFVVRMDRPRERTPNPIAIAGLGMALEEPERSDHERAFRREGS